MMPLPVRISNLGLYLRCPRLVYFQAMGHSVYEKTNLTCSLLIRNLAISLSHLDPESRSEMRKKGGIERWLASQLEKAERELPIIYPGEINPDDLCKAATELEMRISRIAETYAPWLDLIPQSKAEVDFMSERLGLSGRLDRLIEKDHPIPSIIRTGMPPKQGIWHSERIRLTGYALLLEDARGERINAGLVEYPRAGVIRQVKIRSIDRSRVLRIRDRIRQIDGGRLPEKPKSAPCDKCHLKEKCEVQRSLASKFF